MKALYDYTAQEAGELTMVEGDVLELVADEGGWMRVRSQRTGETGEVPGNYLSPA